MSKQETKANITNQADYCLKMAEKLSKNALEFESFDGYCIPNEYSKTALKRQIVQLRQELKIMNDLLSDQSL